MRILIWAIPYLPVTGGREIFAARLAADLARRGHEVLVVAPQDDGPVAGDLSSPVEIVRVPVGGLIDAHQLIGLRLPTDLPAARCRVVEVLDRFRPQVVHAQALAPDLILLGPLARERGLPIVVTDHSMGALPQVASLAITQRVSRIPDAVVAVSGSVADGLRSFVPAVADRLSVIPNGVPLPPSATPVDVRGPAVFLGRLSPEKGVAVALTAWSVVARGDRERELVVAGTGPDQRTLEGLARHLGVADQVRFAGWLDEGATSRLLDAASVVLMPSLWAEPFGLVAAEAAAHGRPVVASRTGGLPDVVVDGRTGWLVDPGDIPRLVGVLNGTAANPASLVEAGRAAREHAQETLGLDRCVGAYLAVYERLAA